MSSFVNEPLGDDIVAHCAIVCLPAIYLSHPGCIFLGVKGQLTLGYHTVKHLPFASYTRKVLGYLYAIEHGARFIYDTDDDNHPLSGDLQNFEFQDIRTGLVYTSNDSVMNPYAHFGHPSIWPRGYPLEQVANENRNEYHLCTFQSPAIQQGLVNGDPDVDAIFRLTKKKPSNSHLNVTFDGHAPPCMLSDGIFAPFNSQNTLFRYEALWAMVLPASVAFRVTDIWRGYWAQKLLWIIGHHLAFFPPNAFQLRNPHNYLQDFQEEDQFYMEAGRLVKYLSEWTCPMSVLNYTFFQCVRQLSHDMANQQFWLKSDALLIDAWLDDLLSVGYKEPLIKSSTMKNICLEGYSVNNVSFAPARFDPSPTSNILDLFMFCENNFLSAGLPHKTKTFSNVLLVVVFNFPYHGNIQFVDTLYRDHFPNILYCSNAVTYNDLWREVTSGPFNKSSPWMPLSFANVTASHGYFGYECAIRAMEMHYNVDGYLIIGDDVLFNFWNFHKLQKMNIPLLDIRSLRHSSRLINTTNPWWLWWETDMGYKPVNVVFDQMLNTSEEHFLTFFENRHSKSMNDSIVSFCLADIYYVPQWTTNMFIQVANLFLKHKVFLEIAVPTTLLGLASQNMTKGKQQLLGYSLWGNDRLNPFRYYNAKTHHLHPVKLSTLFTNSALRQSFCKIYVQDLIHNW